MLKILIIEDDYRRIDKFEDWLPAGFRAVVVKSAGTALGLLERDRGYLYAGICLDHDLQQQTAVASDRDLSGTSVVAAIIRHLSPQIPVLIHSRNKDRARYMGNQLSAHGFDVVKIPMDLLDKEHFHDWLEEAQETWEDNHEV